ncbi:hypothetical protein L3X38_013113 [Prunus dulcis]|uniref:Uncharacterized protein n=1 Tax=Prunus dulcis TaxID=3755 RepID=A0AAD4WLC2_PRUDU|nr:hypothetical protein L3X38_013113 [Prunus dulcis]
MRGYPKRLGITENSQNHGSRLEIGQILPNHQLDYEEGMNFHTLIAENSCRTIENEAGEVSVKINAIPSSFRRNPALPGLGLVGEGRGTSGSSNKTGLEASR